MATIAHLNRWFFVLSLALLALFTLSLRDGLQPEWKRYQIRCHRQELIHTLEAYRQAQAELEDPQFQTKYEAARKSLEEAQTACAEAQNEYEKREAEVEELELQTEWQPTEERLEIPATPTGDGEVTDKERPASEGGHGVAEEPEEAAASQAELETLEAEFEELGEDEGGTPEDVNETAENDGTGGNGRRAVPPPPPPYEEAAWEADPQAAQRDLERARTAQEEAQHALGKARAELPEDDLYRQIAEARVRAATARAVWQQARVRLEQTRAAVKEAARRAKLAAAKQAFDQGDPSQDEGAKQYQAELQHLARQVQELERKLTLLRRWRPRIQQMVIGDLHLVDRCLTCHEDVTKPTWARAAPHFRFTAPYLTLHPPDQFGCVPCHQGQGYALTKAAAHGRVEPWPQPLLTGDLAQAACGQCHRRAARIPGAPVWSLGRQLFVRYGCAGCHPTDGYAEGEKGGPDLSRVGEKVNAAWLLKWLKDPGRYWRTTRMPRFEVQGDEAQAMIAYLMNSGGAREQRSKGAEEQGSRGARETTDHQSPTTNYSKHGPQVKQGERLVEELGCRGCHTIQGRGSDFAPNLSRVGEKVNAAWLLQWMKEPRSYLPQTKMPNFRLTDAEAKAIAAFLMTLKAEEVVPDTATIVKFLQDPQLQQRGEQLLEEKGCTGCHPMKPGFEALFTAPPLSEIGDKRPDELAFGHAANVPRTLANWLFAKLQDTHTFDTEQTQARMPNYGFSDRQAKALRVFLMSLSARVAPPQYVREMGDPTSPLTQGGKLVDTYQCLGCHRIGGRGGDVGPNLTRMGERLQIPFLYEYLRRPERIRPGSISRMPTYGFTDQEATILTNYFMALSQQRFPYDFVKLRPLSPERKRQGKAKFDELQCLRCHSIRGRQEIDAEGGARNVAPDLAQAAHRLKPDWALKWLREPQDILPGTMMPSYNQPEEINRLLRDYVMDLGNEGMEGNKGEGKG